MPVFQPSTGMPGISAEKVAKHRTVTADGYLSFLPGGVILSDVTRDPDNPDYAADGAAAQRRLRSGLLLGKVTASGEWANSVIGALQGAVAAAATSITLTEAQAVELVRRVGSSGTLLLTGPPAAAGTVATQTVTYSAVNTTTGVVTVTALAAAAVAGSFVGANDGSQTPRSFLSDGWELPMPESGDMPLDKLPLSGNIDASKLLPWPADTSLQQWVRDKINEFGKFVFVERYAP